MPIAIILVATSGPGKTLCPMMCGYLSIAARHKNKCTNMHGGSGHNRHHTRSTIISGVVHTRATAVLSTHLQLYSQQTMSCVSQLFFLQHSHTTLREGLCDRWTKQQTSHRDRRRCDCTKRTPHKAQRGQTIPLAYFCPFHAWGALVSTKPNGRT